MKRFLKIFLISTGSIALLMVILAFTTLPFWLYYWLGTSKAGLHRPPEYIVVLSGGGMPSGSGMMRCYYAGRAAKYFPKAKIIIAMPGDTSDSLSSVMSMRKELMFRGVPGEKILLEDSGTNTRSQALNIYSRISNIELRIRNVDAVQDSKFVDRYSKFVSILIITSPEHLYRAVRAFRKAGFYKVDGLPAFEQTIEADLEFIDTKLGGRRLVPGIGDNLTLRYEFWTQMNYERLVLREYSAIFYYWLKGWI